MWRPGLLALDIDGTLVDVHEHATSSVVQAVQSAKAAGAHIVLSTGRSVFGIERIIELLELDTGHCVASNGAVTFTYPPTEVTSAVTFDARPAVRMILEHVPDALVAVEVVGRGYRANGLFPEGEITGEMWMESVDELIREPVTRVIIRDPQSSAEDFMALAERVGLHGTNYFVGYTAWLDLAPEGVSKASALAEVAAVLGVAQADVLAIGDGRNDLEMLAWAGRGVAMGQAPLEVQSVADEVTGSLTEDGVALEIGRWFDI
ncbi:MAG: HAD family phosphatase [Nocardioidaceae bacterium]|nr:HAD family phosphatase [Nocardioidaceae bacterium]